MYDELIKRLRKAQAVCEDVANDLGRPPRTEYAEAADAIEELQQIAAHYEETAHDYFKDVCYYLERVPKWIPVTERLPKAERKSYWVCTDTGYQCECRWTNNRFGIGESDEWGWSIFDIPQYQKVVAWMLLPDQYEQSKEET